MNRPLNAKGEPLPLTEVPRFEPGRGRPDLEALHTVVYQIDTGLLKTPYEIREWIAGHLSSRPDRQKPITVEMTRDEYVSWAQFVHKKENNDD